VALFQLYVGEKQIYFRSINHIGAMFYSKRIFHIKNVDKVL